MEQHTARRCVLYARLSVTKEESVSIERQLASCRRYAEARGWEVVGEFVDDGVSATANRPEDRKGWKALLAAPSFDAAIIWKVDRLARRVFDFLHAHETLQARGAGLVAVDDPIDMTSPQGRAFAVMLAVFGEMEAEAIRARVRAARAQLLTQGRWPGGGVPYGYRSIPNSNGPGRVLDVDPERRPWLEEAVSRALAGATVNSIAVWLTAVGAPLPLASERRRRSGDVGWTRQTVAGLLRNPMLAGMTPCNPGRGRSGRRADPFAVVRDHADQPVVVKHLAVLTLAEFENLQRDLDQRSARHSAETPEPHRTSEFLAGVAVCDHCDAPMYRGTNQGQATLYCSRCRQTISRRTLDPYVISRLLTERGDEPATGQADALQTVVEAWAYVGENQAARRELLLAQLASLRIRRGVVGRRFDPDRALITWRRSVASLNACRNPGAN